MMLQLVVLLAVLSVAFGGVSTAKVVCILNVHLYCCRLHLMSYFTLKFRHYFCIQTVSASIKDANVEGLEGLNLKINVPFKVEDYTVGVRHTFGNSLKSGPEAVFVKRTFDTSQGSVAVDVEYETANNVFNVATKWVSDKLHLTLGLEGSSNDKIKSVEIANSEDVKGSKVDTKLTYDVLSRKISGESSVERDDTRVKLTYDTEEKDPVVS